MPTDVVRRRQARRGTAVLVLSLLVTAVLLGCTGTTGGDVGPPGGHDAPTAAVQAYLEANGFTVYYVDSCSRVTGKFSSGNPLYWCHYVDRDCPQGMLEEPCTTSSEGYTEFERLGSSCFAVGDQGVAKVAPGLCGH